VENAKAKKKPRLEKYATADVNRDMRQAVTNPENLNRQDELASEKYIETGLVR